MTSRQEAVLVPLCATSSLSRKRVQLYPVMSVNVPEALYSLPSILSHWALYLVIYFLCDSKMKTHTKPKHKNILNERSQSQKVT